MQCRAYQDLSGQVHAGLSRGAGVQGGIMILIPSPNMSYTVVARLDLSGSLLCLESQKEGFGSILLLDSGSYFTSGRLDLYPIANGDLLPCLEL